MVSQQLLQQNILTVLGLQDIPEPKKIALLEKVAELVLRRITLRIAKEIKDEDKEEADKVFGSGNDEDKLTFLQSRTNFTQLLTEELLKVKEELLEDLKEFSK